ncbi:MAG TPA: alkaline phosphatase family protein [Solirubrobacteraceae bacterium]|nr:alkaline phosphatase family protein [Solirubrobacteraceae bacterium]
MRSFAEIPTEVAHRVAADERIVLILLDALGLELLERERDHPLMTRLAIEPIQSQFPSTTAAHVTTMHLGLPVQEHGIYEWRVLEPTLGEVIVPLRFRRDASDRDAELEGRLDPRALINTPTLYQSLRARSLAAEPFGVSGTPYDRVATVGAATCGFRDLHEGLGMVIRALRADAELRYAYLYWPEIDRVGHHHGPGSPEFRATARQALDAVLDQVDGLLDTGATVLLTADHGQVDVRPDRVDYLDELWPELSTHLTQRAAGSARDVFLHVASDRIDHVIDNLQDRLGDRASVCRATALFDAIGPRLAKRLGDVAVLPAGGRQAWLRATPSVETWNLGSHGGLASAERATYLAQVQV